MLLKTAIENGLLKIAGPLCIRRMSSQPHICIVGSGPAGFVVAQTLLKNNDQVKVDMYEKLPVPFGLIRFGVSPDHQDVKNCVHGYTKTAGSDRFSFYGNVDVGKDVSLSQLCSSYHATVLCTGAQGEQNLSVPGEDMRNVLTSKQFVGWYNGVPRYQQLNFDLSGKTAVIVGVGNVALDVARMLLKPTEQLQSTDVTREALEKLSKSNINRVYVVGRRGPLQMACTRKELSEITDLPTVTTFVEPEHFDSAVQNALGKKDLKLRKHQRLVKYLQKVAVPEKNAAISASGKSFHVKFLRSPLSLRSKGGTRVSAIALKKRKMEGNDGFNPVITDTDLTEELPCDLVVSCIGYRNAPLDADLVPFQKGKIIQTNGRVDEEKGLYACGWCSHGPKGVLADSGNDSLLTGSTLLSDLPSLLQKKSGSEGSSAILKLLADKNVTPVTWKGWENIDKHEVACGESAGKIREKVLSIKEMIGLASNS